MLTDMELTLTPRQIKMMKHAIGLDTSNGKVQKNKDVYEAYRNYYSASLWWIIKAMCIFLNRAYARHSAM